MLESSAPNEIVLGQIIQRHVANLHQPPHVIADNQGANDVLVQFFGRPRTGGENSGTVGVGGIGRLDSTEALTRSESPHDQRYLA